MIEISCAKGAQEESLSTFGLAEAPDGTGWCLIFAVDQAEPDEYSVSTADGASAYRAVEAWSVKENILSLRFTQRGAETLGLPSELALRLDPASVDPGYVREALADIANPS